MITIFYRMLFVGICSYTIFACENGEKRKTEGKASCGLPPIEKAEALLQALQDKKVVVYSDTQIFVNSGEFGTIENGKKIAFKKVDMKQPKKSSCGCCIIQ